MNIYNIDGYNRAIAISNNRIYYVKTRVGFPTNN